MSDLSTSSPTTPEPEPGAPPRPAQIRFSSFVLGLYSLSAIVALLLYACGITSPSLFTYLGVALVFAGASAILWTIVERRQHRGGFLLWAAFPFSLLFAFAQLPPLALALYPPLETFVFQAGRAEAWMVRQPEGRFLEIWFPHPLDPEGGEHNLLLDGLSVPPEHYRAHPEHFRITGERTLSVTLEPLLEALGKTSLGSITVNGDLASAHIRYKTGESVPHQTIEVGGDAP